MKKKLLARSKLYCILDYNTLGRKDIISAAKSAILGGADIIQLRFKSAGIKRVVNDASAISRLTAKKNVIFLINDRIDIALLAKADGVHLGHKDMPPAYARKLLGGKKIIGVSTHNIKQARQAQKEKADYISIGPIFPTPTKPEYKAVGLALIKQVKDKIDVPFVAIGGINLNNLSDVLGAGADRVAVVRAVCRAKNIQNAVRNLKRKLNKK